MFDSIEWGNLFFSRFYANGRDDYYSCWKQNFVSSSRFDGSSGFVNKIIAFHLDSDIVFGQRPNLAVKSYCYFQNTILFAPATLVIIIL